MEAFVLISSKSNGVQPLLSLRGGGWGVKDEGEKSKGRGGGRGRRGGGGGSGKDRVDALGILSTHILRHMASELNLDMRSDEFVKVHDLLELNLKTFANIPLSSYTVDVIKEAVRKDNKQRFSLLKENGELLVCVNQGHSTTSTCSTYFGKDKSLEFMQLWIYSRLIEHT